MRSKEKLSGTLKSELHTVSELHTEPSRIRIHRAIS
jgi:hypothetical protein